MRRRPRAVAALVLAVLVSRSPAAGADPSTQLWPRLELGLRTSSRIRFLLAAQSQIAPASGYVAGQVEGEVEMSIAPLRDMLFRTVQPARQERATLGIGYRYGGPIAAGDIGGSQEQRILVEGTFRLLLPAAILATDRNRFEARRLDGDWSWRYRNRLELARSFDARSLRVVPLARAEVFYDSRYDAWPRLRLEAGTEIEELVGHRSMIEVYLFRQLDDRSQTSPVNGVGITLAVYY
jgi:hypothetical protein